MEPKKYKFLSDTEDSDLGISVKKGEVHYGTTSKNGIVTFYINDKYVTFPIMATESLALLEETTDLTNDHKHALIFGCIFTVAAIYIYKLKK